MSRDAASTGIARVTSRFQLPLMFVVMAVQAQQFPVAAVGQVVVVIVVPVMNGQLTKVSVREFATAATADPWIS
jgi:predicted Na+-dependent transporter